MLQHVALLLPWQESGTPGDGRCGYSMVITLIWLSSTHRGDIEITGLIVTVAHLLLVKGGVAAPYLLA